MIDIQNRNADDWQQSLSFDVSGALAPTPTSGPTSMVVVSTDGVAGMTTYQLLLTLPDSMANVYAMVGNAASPLTLPPAYQVATPFGADLGGANPAFFTIANNAALGWAQFDSWITVGFTDGVPQAHGLSATPGFSMASWTATSGFTEADGGIFLMEPDTGPSTGSIVMGQLTVETGTSPTATALLQGRPVDAAADDPQVPVAWSL